jgi:hypothetical protein
MDNVIYFCPFGSTFDVNNLMWSTKGNPNLFGHFFYPYISLNLEKYVIPSNSYSSYEPFIHPYVVNIVFSTLFFWFYLCQCVFYI